MIRNKSFLYNGILFLLCGIISACEYDLPDGSQPVPDPPPQEEENVDPAPSPTPTQTAKPSPTPTPTQTATPPPTTQIPDGEYDSFIAEQLAHILPAKGNSGRPIYVAPPRSGSSQRGSGTKSDPYRDLLTVVATANAGDRIYLQPGVYNMNEIRNRFGHSHSVLSTGNSGRAGNPIILSTDPAEYDPESGRIAVIDFQYGNERPNVRAMAFSLSRDFWIIENLEIRNMTGRGIYLSGYDNIIRNNHIHHLDTDGTNNQGLILITSSGRKTNNFIIRNHMHHVGRINKSTGAVTDYGGVNGGCIYTETRQQYDSSFVHPRNATSVNHLKQGILHPDSHVYIYNNELHHCYKGLSTKTEGEGPYYFIGNIIHNVIQGIRTAYAHSVIQDNIIFAGPDAKAGTGIQIGQAYGANTYLEILNGANIEVSHNTIVGFPVGIYYYGGWSTRSHHNLIVGETEGMHVHRNTYFFVENGSWPGIRGEYLLGDLNTSHPYRNSYFRSMPSVMYQLGLKKLTSRNNAYSKTPVHARSDSLNNGDIQGKIFDEDYIVLTPSEINRLFIDPNNGDYRRNRSIYPDLGSRLD